MPRATTFAFAVAHVWWYRAVERVGASRAAIFQNLTPVVGVLLATTMLGEPIDVWLVSGGLLVLGGVALTTRRPGGPSRPPVPISRAS